MTRADRWERGRLLSGLYDAGVQRPRVGRFFAWVLWRADALRFYAEANALGRLPDTAVVLDVPTGGGVSFRGVRPGGPLLLALDASPIMLRRARRRAPSARSRVRLVQGDAEELPFADASIDLCLTQNGLHCFRRPERALSEMARVLRPGGELRGNAVAAGGGRWPDLLGGAALRLGLFRARVWECEVARWLEASGLEDVAVEQCRALVWFSARRPASTH